ncbi:MAG: Spy/CpxP family protein refolding chaperone [Rhodospirillales bacterium]|nr:Spy/CpxP family protein refolding chaperone [Rhodospirillales bacterium]
MARVESHIAQLRDELHITAAEMPQWDALAATMRGNAASMQRLYQERSARLAHMDAPEILDSYRSFARAHVAALDRLVPAFRRLYAVLTPAQRRTADDLFQDRAEAAGKAKAPKGAR